jgi:hypothetical protein
MGEISGRCLCGAVTYSAAAEPMFAAVCHCRDCQRQSGGAFAVIVAVPEDALSVQGETIGIVRTVGDDHGLENHRRFCTACGSPLFNLSPKLPGVALIRAGTLDDPSWVQPQVEIWSSSAQPWVELAGERPRMERGPQT